MRNRPDISHWKLVVALSSSLSMFSVIEQSEMMAREKGSERMQERERETE